MKRDELSLPDKMRALADQGHPRSDELRQRAMEMEKAIEQGSGAKGIVGAWARARRLWCDCTGEALI